MIKHFFNTPLVSGGRFHFTLLWAAMQFYLQAMRQVVLALILVAGCLPAAVAQDTYYSIFSYTHFIPQVTINDRAASLQSGVYPEYYRTHSVRSDMRWVTRHDSTLTAFWLEKGDTILHLLTELSGIEWYEEEFDIYLVRYFPALGSGDPLIIPMGGMKSGSLIEAAPSGKHQALNLIFQLSRRMLAQTVQPEDAIRLGIADHPLMRPGPYRRDNLALLLAIAVSQNIIGLDSTRESYRSAFWVEHTPGRKLFELYFLNKWVLTPDQTLADWIAAEPYGSRLVVATRPPRPTRRTTAASTRVYIEGLPLQGELGFSVKVNEANYLEIDTIDVYRLAYACGLRAGDRIHSVDNQRVRTHRRLVERILEGLENEGATVRILRDDSFETIIVRHMDLAIPDEELYPDDFLDYDSVSTDSNSLESEY